MSPKEKANKLFNKYSKGKDAHGWNLCEFDSCAKKCTLIAVKNEYHSNRELLFNLKASGIDIPEKVYLSRLQGLIDEEKEVKQEIEKL